VRAAVGKLKFRALFEVPDSAPADHADIDLNG
jgi:hypothetical protein